MNIAIDIRSLMVPHLSGVGEYTCQLVDTLLEIDKENRYFLWSNSFHDLSDTVWQTMTRKWSNYDHVEICHYKMSSKALHSSFKAFSMPKVENLLYKEHANGEKEKVNIDTIFMPNLHFIGLKKNTKLALAVHDLSYELYPEFFSHQGKLWHRIINPKKLFNRAQRIITVSENTKRDVSRLFGIPVSKITTCYPGVGIGKNAALRREESHVLQKRLSIPDGYILYLGTLEPRKNVQGLIDAYNIVAQRLSDCPDLVIAGKAGWLYEDIYKRAFKSKYTEKIHITGYIEPEDKPGIYHGAKLFVYPSFYEGFGFPPLEAISCSIPVITGNAGSIPEVVGDSALLVDPYNTEEIARAIEEALLDKKLSAALIEKGRERIKRFSWIKCAEETLEALMKT